MTENLDSKRKNTWRWLLIIGSVIAILFLAFLFILFPLNLISNIFSVWKDAILGISAIVGTTVAMRGLNTWNRQLKGKTEYELARRLLRATYNLREDLNFVRHPVILSFEKYEPPEDESQVSTPEREHRYKLLKVYEKRWELASASRLELKAELIEAEVIWDAQIVARFQELLKLYTQLFMETREYLTDLNPDAGYSRDKEQKAKTFQTFHPDLGGVRKDDISDKMEASISEIETALKPHLKVGE